MFSVSFIDGVAAEGSVAVKMGCTPSSPNYRALHFDFDKGYGWYEVHVGDRVWLETVSEEVLLLHQAFKQALHEWTTQQQERARRDALLLTGSSDIPPHEKVEGEEL